MMRSCVVIPARYKSTRFPGKPLAKLLNKSMILWVAELSAIAVGKKNVYIATEDHKIIKEVNKFGFNAVLTSENALTGTDRIAEATSQIEADIYLNVQGDEPIINPDDIIKIRDAKIENMKSIINGFCWISDNENPDNTNIPKLITNEKNELVYMSRLALPGSKKIESKPKKFKKQVCIYAFTKNELISFNNFGRKSKLEEFEDIEILRFLELNKTILMIETESGSVAVDTPEDILKAEKALKLKSSVK